MERSTRQTAQKKAGDQSAVKCENCGARLQKYEAQKGGEKVGEEKGCPNHWREGERFEDCPEVVQ